MNLQILPLSQAYQELQNKLTLLGLPNFGCLFTNEDSEIFKTINSMQIILSQYEDLKKKITYFHQQEYLNQNYKQKQNLEEQNLKLQENIKLNFYNLQQKDAILEKQQNEINGLKNLITEIEKNNNSEKQIIKSKLDEKTKENQKLLTRDSQLQHALKTRDIQLQNLKDHFAKKAKIDKNEFLNENFENSFDQAQNEIFNINQTLYEQNQNLNHELFQLLDSIKHKFELQFDLNALRFKLDPDVIKSICFQIKHLTLQEPKNIKQQEECNQQDPKIFIANTFQKSLEMVQIQLQQTQIQDSLSELSKIVMQVPNIQIDEQIIWNEIQQLEEEYQKSCKTLEYFEKAF